MASVFISHNSADKPFARELATKLKMHGVQTWIDEAEINIGDSLIHKIATAIHDFEYLLVVLSENSLKSKWVYEELKMAYSDQLRNDRVKILPVLKDRVKIPPELKFLEGTRYADLSTDETYDSEFKIVLRTLGVNVESTSKGKAKIIFNNVYKRRPGWYTLVLDQYVLFDGQTYNFKNEVIEIDVTPGIHTFKFCADLEIIYEDGSGYYTRESIPQEVSLNDGLTYYYECDIEQGRKFLVFHTDKVIIRFVKCE